MKEEKDKLFAINTSYLQQEVRDNGFLCYNSGKDESEKDEAMDIQYLLFLQELREASGNVFDAFFIEITTYSEALAAFVLLGFVYWCVDKRTGAWMAFNVAISCTWNQVVKNICRLIVRG